MTNEQRMMMPKKKTPEFLDLIQADIVNYKIEANGSTAGANKGSIAPGPPPAEQLDLYRGMFDAPENCLRRSRRVGGDGGDSYYGSVATRSTAGL
jgi:hypothetical protein